jgi:hypothetical protein
MPGRASRLAGTPIQPAIVDNGRSWINLLRESAAKTPR